MDSGLLSLIGVLIAVVIFIVGVYKNFPTLVIGPLASIVVCVFSSLPIIDTMGSSYAEKFGGFATNYFLLFLPACALGAMIADSGAAEDIAIKISKMTKNIEGEKRDFWVLMGLSLITAILSFGGVSGFVVIFTIAPICYSIFKELDIPWHFVIAVAVYGGSMWTAILPGSPAVQNLIPINYLGTSATSAPVIGIICASTCIVFGAWYIWFQLGRNAKRGEGFEPTGLEIEKVAGTLNTDILNRTCTNWQFIKALIPSIVLLVAMNVFQIEPWVSLLLGCITCGVLYFKHFKNIGNTLAKGCTSTMKSIMNVSAVVGFGGVVAVTPGFEFVVNNLNKMPGSPLFQLALATNIIAGVTASASGGEGIALETFANKFLAMGIPADQLHRIVNISCYGLDSMPYNGSVINRLDYTHLTVKNGYYHELILGAIFPFFNSFLAVLLATLGLH
jgi:H+/gluconate symporter-like permease